MIRRFTLGLVLMAASTSLVGCAAGMGAGHDSPTQARFELRVSPRIWASDAGKYEVRASAGYEGAVSGGGGHFIDAGAQMRMNTTRLQQTGKGLWLGAEAFYVKQLSGTGQTSRHGVLVGMPIRELDYGILHFYAGGGLSIWSGVGWYLRGGVELIPKKK